MSDASSVDVDAAVSRLTQSGRNATLRRLANDQSLAQLAAWLEPLLAQPLVLALDFDQTIKSKDRRTNLADVRGGADSAAWLRRVCALPTVHACIITAANVSASGARAIAEELAQIGLADLFDVDACPRRDELVRQLLEHVDDADANVVDARRRLAAVLVLQTARFATDLPRIARASVSCGDASVQYRLVRDGQCGALLTERDPAVVRCWRAYHARFGGGGAADGDELAPYFDADADELARDVRAALAPLGVAERHVERLLRDTAAVHDRDGVKVARYGRVLCSKYNKPEALQLFLAQERLAPANVVFVDDNLTNAFNMFAAHQGAAAALHSFWYEPPPGGKEETVRDETAVQIALKVMAHFETS